MAPIKENLGDTITKLTVTEWAAVEGNISKRLVYHLEKKYAGESNSQKDWNKKLKIQS